MSYTTRVYNEETKLLTTISSQTLVKEGRLEDGAVIRTYRGEILVVRSHYAYSLHLFSKGYEGELLGYLPPE